MQLLGQESHFKVSFLVLLTSFDCVISKDEFVPVASKMLFFPWFFIFLSLTFFHFFLRFWSSFLWKWECCLSYSTYFLSNFSGFLSLTSTWISTCILGITFSASYSNSFTTFLSALYRREFHLTSKSSDTGWKPLFS